MKTSTVLVVDDDFDLRESLVELLEDEGFEARWARDGSDGLIELKPRPHVQVILLDLSMPTMTGRDFRSEQLADPQLASIPVIVLSGEADYREAAAAIGAAAALPKPFAPDALLDAIHEVRARAFAAGA
jgi:CheY-like chemotaxis protein